jgi:hypothetical protein
MLKHILVKQKYRQLIMHWSIIFGIFLVLSACGDLVEESETGACDNAIDARNYDKALLVCTSRKDRASAFMGKAGYDIINLLKSSGTPVKKYTKPTALGIDDIAGASILNILRRSKEVIPDYATRATEIKKSKTNLDLAYALLQPNLLDNSSSPLTKDEILLNTFAISFAMQLDQIILFDNETTSTFPVPRSPHDNLTLTCSDYQVDISDSDAQANLRAMDGHLWSTERNGMLCARVLNAYNAEDDKTTAAADLTTWVQNTASGDNDSKLPPTFYDVICPSFIPLKAYLKDLTANILKFSLSGDNTKAIREAQTSSDKLIKSIGCFD